MSVCNIFYCHQIYSRFISSYLLTEKLTLRIIGKRKTHCSRHANGKSTEKEY